MVRWLNVASALLVASLAVAAPGTATGAVPAPGDPANPATTSSAAADPANVLAGSPTLSIADRLDQRRFVTAGTRAYEVGTEAGRYYAMGFHTRGEMAGIWTPPLKLLDGLWFAVDGRWLTASRFTEGYGYSRMDFPAAGDLTVTRTDFVPDGVRALLVGLTFRAPRAQTVTLALDAHSELMSAYPWGQTNPSQKVMNLPDSGSVRDGRLVFRDRGTPPVPGATRHDWAAVVGAAHSANLHPAGAQTGPAFRGPQDPPVSCPTSDSTAPQPSRCDDTAYGKGTGGQLRYRVTVPAGRSLTTWFAVAGSDRGLPAAQAQFAAAAGHPIEALADKLAARRAVAANTVLSLPGDRLLADAIAWGKQNLADETQQVGGPAGQPLLVRTTNAGTNYPPPAGTVDTIGFYAAGYPDYPWMFATDGEYTAFAGLATGQFHTVQSHLRALRDVSDVANAGSGKVVHEVVTDGSVYFGANTDPGNTDETVKFPSAVALTWRWTGDRRFLDDLYGFTKRNLDYVAAHLTPVRWPEGAGNVERAGQGPQKVDNAVYWIRGLTDEIEMATAEGDHAEVAKDQARLARVLPRFEPDWWFGGTNPGSPTAGRADSYADSRSDPGGVRIYQRYWTGVTPMEAQPWLAGHATGGLAVPAHANAALALRETGCFTSASGLVHTGSGQTTNPNTPQPYPTVNCTAPGATDAAISNQPDERDVFTLNTAVMAVAEGNYGRLGPNQQQRYTEDNARLMFTPDEMPGAMDEIAPSDPHPPYYGQSLERLFTERAQVMQAWGNYGTMWPVVHQQLGVSPDLGLGQLEVVPQVPAYATGPIRGRNIRLGSGAIDVTASHDGSRYETVVDRDGALTADLTIGHTLPAGSRIGAVMLAGRAFPFTVRDTTAGRQVLVNAATARYADLVITVR